MAHLVCLLFILVVWNQWRFSLCLFPALFSLFWDRVLLRSPGWPETLFVSSRLVSKLWPFASASSRAGFISLYSISTCILSECRLLIHIKYHSLRSCQIVMYAADINLNSQEFLTFCCFIFIWVLLCSPDFPGILESRVTGLCHNPSLVCFFCCI